MENTSMRQVMLHQDSSVSMLDATRGSAIDVTLKITGQHIQDLDLLLVLVKSVKENLQPAMP